METNNWCFVWLFFFFTVVLVTLQVLLTLSLPSHCERVTFLFLPLSVLLGAVHLRLFTSPPVSPSIWTDECDSHSCSSLLSRWFLGVGVGRGLVGACRRVIVPGLWQRHAPLNGRRPSPPHESPDHRSRSVHRRWCVRTFLSDTLTPDKLSNCFFSFSVISSFPSVSERSGSQFVGHIFLWLVLLIGPSSVSSKYLNNPAFLRLRVCVCVCHTAVNLTTLFVFFLFLSVLLCQLQATPIEHEHILLPQQLQQDLNHFPLRSLVWNHLYDACICSAD